MNSLVKKFDLVLVTVGVVFSVDLTSLTSVCLLAVAGVPLVAVDDDFEAGVLGFAAGLTDAAGF